MGNASRKDCNHSLRTRPNHLPLPISPQYHSILYSSNSCIIIHPYNNSSQTNPLHILKRVTMEIQSAGNYKQCWKLVRISQSPMGRLSYDGPWKILEIITCHVPPSRIISS